MRSRKRSDMNLPEGDDGRTIVDMNVEGMPWYSPKRPEVGGNAPEASQLTRAESRVFVWGALKAALLVVGVMSAGLVLFVLFCQWVWFR